MNFSTFVRSIFVECLTFFIGAGFYLFSVMYDCQIVAIIFVFFLFFRHLLFVPFLLHKDLLAARQQRALSLLQQVKEKGQGQTQEPAKEVKK